LSAVRRALLALVTLLLSAGVTAQQATPTPPPGDAVRIAYAGRMVTDLDSAVAFYSLLGFTRDTSVDGQWHADSTARRLFDANGIETREALMVSRSNVSQAPFNLRLTQVRGVKRRDRTAHTPWEPGATHFGLVVTDAQAHWETLRAKRLLQPRSWGGELVGPPGQKGMLAYMTDPDGLDIELIDERPGRPAGISHMGLIVLDADRARTLYEGLFGGQLQSAEAPWLSGDFYDSAVGGHGNILRFYNLGFPEAAAPEKRMNLELVEFQNRKKPVEAYRITDRGIGYLAIDVPQFDSRLAAARKLGAKLASRGIVKLADGRRVALIRDPDTGAFLLLREAS
jgi:catechol 2,3-dioxygenase-like lactoylglutathione lyase family enzyme